MPTTRRYTFLATGALLSVAVAGQALAQSCHTSSNYDITLIDGALQFDRKSTPPQRLEMRRGVLSVNSRVVALSAEDRKRVAAFETKVRGLIPKIKTIGQRGVDLMVVAIREEAANSSPAAAVRPELNARVDMRAQELKSRIANSTTSKEWQPAAMSNYMATILADVAPLISGDLAQKALDLTMKGDLNGVMALGNQATALRDSLEKRIRSKLDTLQPDLQALCPSVRELDRIESAITQPLPDRSRLNLIKVDS
jgi:hypothetical protein